MRVPVLAVVLMPAALLAGCGSGGQATIPGAAGSSPVSDGAHAFSLANDAARSTPAPTPEPTALSYDATSACIFGKRYVNDVLPQNEGEFETQPLDRAWWGRTRGNTIGGNQYSGFETSWGRNQANTYFGDEQDGISYPSDDPFYWGADTAVAGSPTGVRIEAQPMPAHLVGNPQVNGAGFYAGVLDTPVDQQYGFFVDRLRMPSPDPGMFPAAWLLTNDGTRQGANGPLDGEWDLQEMFGGDLGDGMSTGTILWNSGQNRPQNWGGIYPWTTPWIAPGSVATSPSTGYHDYAALIQPGGARISPNDAGRGGPGYTFDHARVGVTNYIDGVPIFGHTGGADVTSGIAWKEMMAMFQVAPPGSWLGTPDPSQFPAYYWVQWIRVYRPTTTSC